MKIITVCVIAVAAAWAQGVTQPRFPASLPPTPLSALLREAERDNPAIRRARRMWRAARRIPSQVSSLPDPEFNFSTMNIGGPLPLTGQFDQMMGYAGIGVSEALPFPGKLRLRGDMAVRAAAVAGENVASVRRGVVAAVASTYYTIGGLQETLAILARDRRLLAVVARVAANRYAVGKGNQADVLHAQLAVTQLLVRQTVQRREWAIAEARLKQLLNRPLASPPIVAARLQQSPPPPAPPRLAAGIAANPDLRARALERARAQLGVKLAHRDFYPDFRIGYMYQATGPSFPYRSSFSVGVSLPVFFHRKQDAALSQAGEALAASRDAYAAERESLAYQARQWYLQARADAQLLRIYRGGLLPQAAATWRATLAEYESGREDFQTVIAAFLDYQNMQESYWRTLARHETALARLREVAGAYGPPPGRHPGAAPASGPSRGVRGAGTRGGKP
jgi:cobalt-zinc-cadmium efflux system outer membrane protein